MLCTSTSTVGNPQEMVTVVTALTNFIKVEPIGALPQQIVELSGLYHNILGL